MLSVRLPAVPFCHRREDANANKSKKPVDPSSH